MADLTYSVDISSKKALDSLKKLQKEVKRTDNSFAKLGKSLAGGAFKVASAGLKSLSVAAVAASAAFVAFGTKAINTLDDIEKASSKLGVSARFLTTWQKIARESGLTTDQFTVGLQRFLRRLGEAQNGAGTLVKPLEQLGIALRDNNGNLRDGTDVFQDYVRAINEAEGNTEKLRLAFAAFDTEGVAMVNVAKLSAEQIAEITRKAEEAGIVLDDKLVKAAAKAKDAFADLIDVGKGFGLQFFGSLAPALERFTKDLRAKIIEAVQGAGGMEAFSRDLAAQFLRGMETFITAMASIIDGIVNAFQQGANILNKVIVAISKIPFAGFDAVIGSGTRSQAIESLKSEIGEIDKQIEELTQSSINSGNIMDQSTTYFIDGLMLKKKALRDEITKLEDETTMYLQNFETGGTAAQDAVSGVTTKLLEQADALEKAAQIQRDFNKFEYDDRILRIARENEGTTVADDTNDTTTAANSATIAVKNYDDAILRHARNIEATKQERKDFEQSFLSLKQRLLPLQHATKTYNTELRILNRALREGSLTTEEHELATKNLKDAYDKFVESMEPERAKTWVEGWKEAFKEYSEAANNAAQNAKDLFTTATRGMEDAIVDFAKTGKLSFRSLLQDIAEQLLRSQIRQLMANLFGGGVGGGAQGGSFLGNLFGGFFAQGGYIGQGKFGIVGERGPELVNGPANITPGVGSSGAVTYNINAVDVDSFRNLVASDPQFIHAVVQQGQQDFRSA